MLHVDITHSRIVIGESHNEDIVYDGLNLGEALFSHGTLVHGIDQCILVHRNEVSYSEVFDIECQLTDIFGTGKITTYKSPCLVAQASGVKHCIVIDITPSFINLDILLFSKVAYSIVKTKPCPEQLEDFVSDEILALLKQSPVDYFSDLISNILITESWTEDSGISTEFENKLKLSLNSLLHKPTNEISVTMLRGKSRLVINQKITRSCCYIKDCLTVKNKSNSG